MKKLSALCITFICLFEAKSQTAETLNLNQVSSPSNFSNDPDGQSALQSRLRYIAQWQSGTLGRFAATDQWIGIGQPINPATGTYLPLYGTRIQWQANSLNLSIKDNGPASTALLDFGTDINAPSPSPLNEMKIRFFTDPTLPSSAFDFMTFVTKFKNIRVGQGLNNAYGSQPKLAVYDGVNPVPFSNPPMFSTCAVYGVSEGVNLKGIPLDYAAGIVGDVQFSAATLGNFAVLGTAPAGAGNWAGFFNGPVFSSVGFFGSDRKLKRDIEQEKGALEKIMQLKPSRYLYRSQEFKTLNVESALQHGFIAQELETVFPEMVTEVNAPSPIDPVTGKAINPNRFKAVNYNGLHAIEVAAIQELKAEIEALKTQLASASTYVVEPTNMSEAEKTALKDKAWSLSQNTPNPFSAVTTIRYAIPATAGNAMVAVFDLNGKMLLRFAGLKGTGQLTIQGNALQPGMYPYSLLQDGEEVVTRKMILTR